jgi:hypothetical protein
LHKPQGLKADITEGKMSDNNLTKNRETFDAQCEKAPVDLDCVEPPEDKYVACEPLKLLQTPKALLTFYLDLLKGHSLADSTMQVLGFYLLPRLKLDLKIDGPYLDRVYANEMENSSMVNKIFGLLPSRLQDLFIDKSPFSGFSQFLSTNDISSMEGNDPFSILNIQHLSKDPVRLQKIGAFGFSLELLLETEFPDDPQIPKLPTYQQLQPDMRTAAFVVQLLDYVAATGFGGINCIQLSRLSDCISYTKRFYRERWRVEIEDFLEAWYIINHCRRPPSPLSQSNRKILDTIARKNRQGQFPSQRKIIAVTGLTSNTVNKALGLNIKGKYGQGNLIMQRYTKFCESHGGYAITELGKVTLEHIFCFTADGALFTPRNPIA